MLSERQKRDQKIIEQARAGVSLVQIASRYRLTKTRVRQIVNKRQRRKKAKAI